VYYAFRFSQLILMSCDHYYSIIHKLRKNVGFSNDSNCAIDLVLDGGAFSGSYLIGCMFYLQSLEHDNIISIKRVSGTSIGSLLAITYFLNDFENCEYYYNISAQCFHENHDLTIIDDILNMFKNKMKLWEKQNGYSFYRFVSDKLFVNYFDVTQREQIVVSHFENNEHICQCIKRSCFVPFVINGDMICEDKYIDGLYPYLFQNINDTCVLGSRVLFLQLSSYCYNCLHIENERDNNSQRILTGILDIHRFFLCDGKKSTSICSFLDQWNYIHYFVFYLRVFITHVIVLFIYFLFILKRNSLIDNFYSKKKLVMFKRFYSFFLSFL